MTQKVNKIQCNKIWTIIWINRIYSINTGKKKLKINYRTMSKIAKQFYNIRKYPVHYGKKRNYLIKKEKYIELETSLNKLVTSKNDILYCKAILQWLHI